MHKFTGPKKRTFETKDYGPVVMICGNYPRGVTSIPYIALQSPEGEHIATLTINLSDQQNAILEPGEFIVRTTEENESIAKDALASGIFHDTGKRVRTGYIFVSIWKLAEDTS